jgi:hypothetical protein
MKPTMKSLSASVILILIANSCFAQYYYQDIIATQQANEKWKAYKDNKVKSVIISSFESNNQPTEGFECRQTVAKDYSQLSTYTKTDFSRETTLVSFYAANGQLQKTIDTSKNYQSITEYSYDPSGNIAVIKNSSAEQTGEMKSSEQHLWKFGNDGKPVSMQKIKNNNDTTFISFVKDEKGNIAEEHATHNKSEMPAIYYYYDENKRLTDIVRYNEKAKRLLPDYVFTYNDNSKLSSMLFVPEGSTDYQKWIYEYDEKGLRTKETCFSKQKEMLGKIEYQYNLN